MFEIQNKGSHRLSISTIREFLRHEAAGGIVLLAGVTWEAIAAPVTQGVAAGLLIGKQLGVLTAIALARASGLARLPEGATWGETYGVAILTGIGFTMSLFIGSLAFPGADHIAEMRLGVIGGSILSAVLGLLVLTTATRRRAAEHAAQ